MRTHIRLLAAATVALSPLSAHAQGDWDIVLNGRAIHMNAERDWNEANWGVGFEKEFDTDARWVKVALGNGFRDSADELSYMAGGGVKRRFRLPAVREDFYVDVGVVGFLMTRQDVNNNRPFPGMLPALTVGLRHVALNLTYLPDAAVDRVTNAHLVDPSMKGVFFLQLKLDAGLFGFGGGRRAARLAAAESGETLAEAH
ncbi:MAG TPA: hypothetical protein VIN61_11110 [Gammaproteobacteria bacterium]